MMLKSVKTSFWLVKSKQNKKRKCPIYMRITLPNSIAMVSTGFYITPSYWDKKRMKVKGSSQELSTINKTLNTMAADTQRAAFELHTEGRQLSAHIIKDKLTGKNQKSTTLLSGFQQHLDHIESLLGKDFSKPTYSKYSNTYLRISQYIKHRWGRNDVHLFELDHEFLSKFIDFLKTEYDNSQTTCYKHYQRFTRVVRILVSRGYLDRYPFEGFKIKLPKNKVEFLTIEEINKIAACSFDIDRLEIVKDLFVFSCYSGLAFKEVENLEPKHILQEDNEVWIKIVRQKTGNEFKIPLLPKAVEILEKYKNHPVSIKRKKCLPIPSNQKFNAYLKEIGDVAGISKKLHHHLARKSFSVSVVLQNSVPIETLSLLLGHSSIKVTVDAYSAITDEKIKKDFAVLKSNLNNPVTN
ncbi:site-specific integrase [Marivirga harenae]|uniref:site-specific integrase n=1 Tax=Marivirga harenae TaxID=2010992 RepID=UPI0026DFE31A|nr:site-specific integrase [Marivirga harenae]WKV12202.1 site-specific integrase [Marivirga harenae]